jgi:hypothetical protein
MLSPPRWLALPLLLCCSSEGGIQAPPGPSTFASAPEPEDFQVVDRIVQLPSPEVDVLFVVDDSCSMWEEQAILATNFPTFMSYFLSSGIDYHIGVITTDMDDPQDRGRLRSAQGQRWITPDTTNPNQVFNQLVNVGANAPWEAGRATAFSALTLRNAYNEGFEREDAALHLIFVSDDDDNSYPDPVTLIEFREWLRTHKTNPDLLRAHALIWPPGVSCSSGAAQGPLYRSYATLTGGVVGNICASSWDPFLERLGLATVGLKREFFLTTLPRINTIEVTVRRVVETGDIVTLRFDSCLAGEEEEPCDVEYVPGRNSMVFREFLPASHDEIFLHYTERI